MEAQLREQKAEAAEVKRPNLTGIPTQMKLNFERRSGLSFDDVRVHYNSDKPARLGALAYTQGVQIHVAPGQEHSLPHELGHVIQQKAGRVRPTRWISGLPVNDQPELEHEADRAPVQCMPAPDLSGVVQMQLELLTRQSGCNCGYHALARALLRFFTADTPKTLTKENLANVLTSHAIQMGYSVIGEAFDPAALAYVGNDFCARYHISAKCEAYPFVSGGQNVLQSLDDDRSVVLVPYFRTGNFSPGRNPLKEKRAHWSAIDTVKRGGSTTYDLYEGNWHGSISSPRLFGLPLPVTPEELINSNGDIQSEFDWNAFLAAVQARQGSRSDAPILTGLDAVNEHKKNVVVNQAAANSGPFRDLEAYREQIRLVMDNIGCLPSPIRRSTVSDSGSGGPLLQPMSLAGAVVIVKHS